MTVQLRPWTPEDAPALLAAYKENPDLHAQFGGADLSIIDGTRDFISQRLPFTDSSRNWAITIDNVVAGSVGL